MSERNNDSGGIIFAISIVAVCAYAFILVAFMFLAFLALLGTILCACAWDKPLTLGKWTLTKEEARGFILRGFVGAALVPLFLVFCAALLKFRVTDDALLWAALIGYTLGSVGVEIAKAEAERPAQGQEVLPPPVDVTPPAHRAPPARIAAPSDKPPFRFASWDDEEELR